MGTQSHPQATRGRDAGGRFPMIPPDCREGLSGARFVICLISDSFVG